MILSNHLHTVSDTPYFGYFFAFNSSGLHIRNTIIKKQYDSLLLNYAILPNEGLQKSEPSLMYCQKPNEFAHQAFIQIPFATENSKHIIAKVLPFLPNTELLNKDYSKKRMVSGINIPYNSKFLTNPKDKLPFNLFIEIFELENK